MKKYRLFLTAILIFLASSFCYSRDAFFKGEDYDLKLLYNDTACFTDAVFIRMIFTQTSKKNKITKEDFASTTAKAELYLNNKLLRTSDFYILKKDSSKNTLTLLCGIPLSTWWKQEEDYSLKITYNLYNRKKLEFDLPFTLLEKELVHETIPLDLKNTEIKTDTSPKRMAQIEKLNNLLEKVNAADVYSLNPFIQPVTSTRRTSFFADRRIYEYSNGKSSASIHNGIDFGVPDGTPVTSCAEGKVVMAEERISTGWTIVIEHLPGLYSLYYHLSSLNVQEGNLVKQGDIIGLSGSTGLATGPHLHWEVRLNACEVSPDFFTKAFTFQEEQ